MKAPLVRQLAMEVLHAANCRDRARRWSEAALRQAKQPGSHATGLGELFLQWPHAKARLIRGTPS